MCFQRYLLVLLSLLFIATGALRAESHCQVEATRASVMPCCEAPDQQGHACCLKYRLPGAAACHSSTACSCDNTSHDALLTASSVNLSPEPQLKLTATAQAIEWYDWHSEPHKLNYGGPPRVRGPAGKIYLVNRALLI